MTTKAKLYIAMIAALAAAILAVAASRWNPENLGRFLTEYRDQMAADFIVLTDTANFATGIPALTYQLRGICQVDVEVACLKQPLHSGGWGGPVPDAVQILCQLIAGVTKDDGSLDVPGLYKKIARPSAKQLGRIRGLAVNEA